MSGDCLGLNEFGQGEKGDAFKLHIKLAPRRDTVEVANVAELRQSHELFPAKRHRLFDFAVNYQ